MWRFRHLFLLVCAVSHGVLIGFGYPIIHESITQMLPEWWRNMNSPVGWVFAMAGFWAVPLFVIAIDMALLVAPAMSIGFAYILARRLLPRTSHSLAGLSSWTVGIVLIASAYIALEILVTGGLPTPNVIVHPVDARPIQVVPMAVHVLAVVSSLISACMLSLLIKRGIAKTNAEAV